MQKHKIVIAITGASGSIYAKRLIQRLAQKPLIDQIDKAAIVFSKNALDVWNHELGEINLDELPFQVYERGDYSAPFASGSAKFNSLIACPCSMGTLGRIAHGISDELITRTADVMLKERRKLILVTRDTPLNLIHINNMKTITEAGGIICPASPSFYSKPKDINEVVDSVIDRVIDLAGFSQEVYRWHD